MSVLAGVFFYYDPGISLSPRCVVSTGCQPPNDDIDLLLHWPLGTQGRLPWPFDVVPEIPFAYELRDLISEVMTFRCVVVVVMEVMTWSSLGLFMGLDGFGLTLTRKLNSNSFASWSKDETKRGFKRLYHILARPFGLERWRYASLGRSSHYRLPMRVSGSSRGSIYLKFPGQKGIPQEAFSPLFFGSVELLLDFV
ncbi:hypothetical protein BHE74_00019348 [Ensete ventricosum]|nr:hypothetical protein BHE74_00019348 [Ensete ventricosum]